ncbi:MAG: hypothetical protein ABSE64_05780 [Vulcanimicrobiaceae bacterium]
MSLALVVLVCAMEPGSCRIDPPNKAYLISATLEVQGSDSTLEQLGSDSSHHLKIDLGFGSLNTVVSGAVGGVVEDSGNLVMRFLSGVAVLGPDGKVRRTLLRLGPLGWIARIRPGWIAATEQSNVVLFATDGSSRIPFAHFQSYPHLRSLPNDVLAIYDTFDVYKDHESRRLSIYAGWPLKLVHRERFSASITSVEPLSQSVIAVATGTGPLPVDSKYVSPTVMLYDRHNFKLLAKRQLSEHGWINAMRAFDDQLVVSIAMCDTDRMNGTLRFFRNDLSDGNPSPITTSGPTMLAVVDGTHLAMAESDCRFDNVGSVLEFDSKSQRLQTINDNLSLVFQGDGS